MPLVGTVKLKINRRPAVTVTDFSYDFDTPTTVKAGGYGVIDTAQGVGTGTGSFKMAVRQEDGLEFPVEELALPFSVNFPLGPNRYALIGCVRNKEGLSVQQQQGNTEVTVSFTFQDRKKVK